MLFPPVPRPLNLKMEIDGSHPGLHIANIQRNYFKTPNPDCIRDHPVKSLWPGLSIKNDYPSQRCPGRTLLRISGLLPLLQLHSPQILVAAAPAWVGDSHRAQRRASMGLKHLLSSVLRRGSSLATCLLVLSKSGKERIMLIEPAVC